MRTFRNLLGNLNLQCARMETFMRSISFKSYLAQNVSFPYYTLYFIVVVIT